MVTLIRRLEGLMRSSWCSNGSNPPAQQELGGLSAEAHEAHTHRLMKHPQAAAVVRAAARRDASDGRVANLQMPAE